MVPLINKRENFKMNYIKYILLVLVLLLYYFPLDGMLVHRKVTPCIMSLVPIYTPGWRETKWSKVSCLRKQQDGREQARTTDL